MLPSAALESPQKNHDLPRGPDCAPRIAREWLFCGRQPNVLVVYAFDFRLSRQISFYLHQAKRSSNHSEWGRPYKATARMCSRRSALNGPSSRAVY
jgi:hypothetical protein